ncbi:hypothetical protein AVEN_96003-1 [Araneus ventricosus]|uniref:Uncharacterized protein n=1 Tax=Araneus ventricosus TaxID=182803 RepID=A0A4Y2B5L4_ARAVE|nr:hypothetical protein AVEN_96003-1 [Araneus ventricosus]
MSGLVKELLEVIWLSTEDFPGFFLQVKRKCRPDSIERVLGMLSAPINYRNIGEICTLVAVLDASGCFHQQSIPHFTCDTSPWLMDLAS